MALNRTESWNKSLSHLDVIVLLCEVVIVTIKCESLFKHVEESQCFL